ncbi:MAG: hypothetical protein APF76_07195 [Desulfitibacter sp. BRH_c19]|nr:MAG: hypothetical protein APF76_07195 [Desulfitibacter sp. BRH_c19]
MNYWLLKTEPEEYSWDDLIKDKKGIWDGVKGNQALNNISRIQIGDRVFIYHTGKERSIIGTAEITSDPYPDPTEKDNKYLVFQLVPTAKLERPVSLQKIKELANDDSDEEKDILKNWELVRQPRLSIVPVTYEQWKKVIDVSSNGSIR